MTKKITFRIPDTAGGRDATGYKVRLMVGQTRHMFVLQLDIDNPSILTDYRSGYKLTNLASQALAAYVSNPYAYEHGLNGWRKRAQRWLNTIVDARGEQNVLSMLNSVPRLN